MFVFLLDLLFCNSSSVGIFVAAVDDDNTFNSDTDCHPYTYCYSLLLLFSCERVFAFHADDITRFASVIGEIVVSQNSTKALNCRIPGNFANPLGICITLLTKTEKYIFLCKTELK